MSRMVDFLLGQLEAALEAEDLQRTVNWQRRLRDETTVHLRSVAKDDE